MPRLRGLPPQNNGGYGAGEVYDASRATVFPTFHMPTTRQPGQSKYATPELEAAARPYADIGKVNVSLFDSGDVGGPSQVPTGPAQPNAETIMQSMQLPWMDKAKGESIGGIPGAGLVGAGIDFLSNIAGSIPSTPTLPAVQTFERLQKTPDEQLQPWERQIKSLNQGLFAGAPDSPIMQGKQVAEVYKAYQIAEAHAKGESALLHTDDGTTDFFDQVPFLGTALQTYGFLTSGLKRAEGSGVPFFGGLTGDQLKELQRPDATKEMLGEERWNIKESLEAGEINEDEARDLIATSGFSLSNPNPLGTGTPVHVIANAALALVGEIYSDPLTVPALLATGGGALAKGPVTATMRSITRSVAEGMLEAEAKELGMTVAKYVDTAAGREAQKAAILKVTTAAEERAAATVGRTAATRYLPKSATVAAKQTGRVGAEGITNMDRVQALLDMGAEVGHEWAPAISRGIEGAGFSGDIAVKASPIIRMGQAIDKMTDPFSLFGYWKTGRTVPAALSKQAAHGYMDALGWRVSRRLDAMLQDAGVDPGMHQKARDIAAANHTVQAGDRANRARAVASNSLIQGPNPTEAALSHASRREGDIRRLVRDQVDRTLEFIVPTGKGGRREVMGQWRERAARQMVDFGATEESARRVAATMDERMMRALANDHWGLMIDTLDEAKRAAKPTGTWDAKTIERTTFMGPRQLAQQDARQLLLDIAAGNISAVRTAVHRFDSLSRTVSEALPDSELMDEVNDVLKQLDGKLPVRIEDLSDAPSELADFATAHPQYGLFLRPGDNDLLVPIRNKEGRITSVDSWLDHVTDRTPSVEVTKAKSWREGLLRGISGGELERNVARRFAANMGEFAGLSEAESARLLTAIRANGQTAGVKPTGLTAAQIVDAVDRTPGLTTLTKQTLTKREVTDALLDAYENEMRLVGVLPKLTGFVKKHAEAVPVGHNVRYLSDFLYPTVRFAKNPLFFIQEVPEAPFFLALQGRYPISSVIPDTIARGLEKVPGVRRYGGISQKERTRLWNDKTMVVMDRMHKTSPNAEYDFYEASELARMGLTVAGQMTDPRTPLGRMLGRLSPGFVTDLPVRKKRSVALATRHELGEQWRRSLMLNAPEQWHAVRSFYPKEMSDGEVAVQWALDTMARADPDSIYSTGVRGLFNPSHIGARAEVSDILVRRYAYGATDARNHTWEDLVADVKSGVIGIDHIRREMVSAGADPDYVERTVTKLTFGTPEEFYDAAIANGVSREVVDEWRTVNQTSAKLMGISEHEYLTRRFVGKPLHVDQMGNHVGETLFDDIVESMRVRGKSIPDSGSPDVAAQQRAAREMITGVFPTGDDITKPLKSMPKEQQEATKKVRSWIASRQRREANPLIGAPPSRNIAAQVPPARFGRDEDGNALVPDAFESKPGFVYRTVHSARIGSDWRVGEYAARHPATIYAADDNFVVLRVKQTASDWEDSVAGVAAHENMTSKRAIPAAAVEVLGEDGKWRPVLAPAEQPEALYQTELHTIGKVTPEQYRRQIETMMDPEAMSRRGLRAMTEKDATLAIEWYDHIRRAMFALVDDNLDAGSRAQEAARILVSFGTTQLNTSPADGFRHVFKAYGMRARGETLQLGEAQNIIQQAVGLNPQQLQRLIWGGEGTVEAKGLGQKLFDFIDSLTGSKTRTNGILGPNGNWGPVAVDVHTARDFGFVDTKMGSWVYRLVEKDTPEGLVHGVSSAYDPKVGHVIQMSDGSTEVIPKEMLGDGIPTDDQYDYGVELANDIRDHFNATNFMNREWSSYEVQAIGWYRMQLLKSSEGDAGEVANALFEQSRWMGSSDLVPSVHAPIHEVHPWDVLRPETHRSIHVEGARHASDEAEQMSGARVMTHMDADAVVGGVHRPAQTVELATDPTGAEQYLAHYLLLSEQDSGVLMRDYVGKGAVTGTPNYGKGVGISVDIPARDEAHAQDLLQRYAGDDDGPLRAIGSHTFIARAPDGSLHLRTLWEPKGAGNRREFDKVLGESGIAERLATEDLPADAHDTLVDFVRLSHDWAKDPSGKTYTDVIQRGSGKHGVMRTPQQRGRVIKPYERAYAEAQTALATAIEGGDEVTIKAATKALAVAKKEMEVARAAPAGRPAAEVQELVGAARVRVRETVRAGFDKHAPREVRNERERVLGEARDAAGDALGTDPRWDDVLDLPGARGSNGERLYDRSPNGTVRAAITRADSTSQRTQLYLNRGASPNLDKSLLHELIHGEAWDMDDSAVRAIKGVFAGLEGTPYGTHVPGTPLTEAEHEWLVNQFMLWVEHPDSTHPVLQPLMQHFRGKLGALSTLKTEATGPSRAAIKSLDADLLRLQTRRAKLKQPAAIAKVDAEIVALTAKRRAVAGEVKALRATGGLSPEVKRVLDDIAAKAGSRTETRASTHNVDEADMMEWMQIAMTASQRRANDLVNMRGERSALERSINHPFLGLYPSSYMWGKVLPYLTEFLMAKPFGAKAPFLAYSVGNRMHQSFQRQQQYDPELRNYLYRNEPFLRAMSLLVPGLPWDMPAAMPFWSRRLMENWLTNNVRAMNGQKQEDLDVPGLIVNSALYQMTLRGPDSWEPIAGAAAHAPDILGSMLTGEAPPPELPQAPQP